MVMRHRNFRWQKPKHVGGDDDDDDAALEDDDIGNEIAEVTTEHGDMDEVADEAVGGDYDDGADDDGDGMNVHGFGDLSEVGGATASAARPEEALQNKQDAAEWRLEVERVLPLLKVSAFECCSSY